MKTILLSLGTNYRSMCHKQNQFRIVHLYCIFNMRIYNSSMGTHESWPTPHNTHVFLRAPKHTMRNYKHMYGQIYGAIDAKLQIITKIWSWNTSMAKRGWYQEHISTNTYIDKKQNLGGRGVGQLVKVVWQNKKSCFQPLHIIRAMLPNSGIPQKDQNFASSIGLRRW